VGGLRRVCLGADLRRRQLLLGLGGRTLLDTVGGAIERRALAGDTALLAAVWITGALKLVAAALALALARPWGRRLLPRGLVLVLAGLCAAVLTLYGGLLEVGNALVATHVVKASQPIEWKALWWHLRVSDMSFFVWGILFALALRGFRRATRPVAAVDNVAGRLSPSDPGVFPRS
jgi:Protein of unknown function (DUF3995)